MRFFSKFSTEVAPDGKGLCGVLKKGTCWLENESKPKGCDGGIAAKS